MIPSAEQVVGDYLREHAGVAALGARIVGTTPRDTDQPWVRITLLGDPSVDDPADHLVAGYLQLDCYAGRDGGQAEADMLRRTVRAALGDIATASHVDAVVTGATVGGTLRLPDQDFEPARERYVVSATVWLHEA